ncbi:carbohydrate ABC transporter ATP-binding protein, CUT1 family (TC 3.A.1.1.-) [Halogranum amylolyticum]|uniref:ABC-type D-xylose/L-arabinose transporter n=1 Tax=Halogranum amylolyticum TaxID=660520 RepID=A0A1H8WD20_9EURY|nr:ABC transporter ATP-binding protein [Halogranum amylolyticum]SEP25521.1 carbohydrate ABC transporter ATP-binding protein, CUT1 family (TC 3.A.1.1.-) [Halogranum amylolyticum]
MTHLKLENVTKRYSDVVAVNGVDIDIEEGEFVSLIGPSGCGKSTTLKTISGLTKPSDGLIEIAGRDVTNLPPKDRDIAMVFQNIALFPHMSVRENITFGLRLKNYDSEEIAKRVDEAAEILQIEGMLDRMPDELSGGQRQRVAIGRAIVMDPEVFLMDEPLANLDAKLRVHMRTELQRLQQELGVTTVYVTHDQAEAMTMSDRVAIINSGELQQFAPPLECYNYPTNLFVAGFIGSPSMRFVPGIIEGDSFSGQGIDMNLPLFSDIPVEASAEVTLGVRPEDVYQRDSAPVEETTDPIALQVDVVQPMGNELVVYLRPDDSSFGFDTQSENTEAPASGGNQLLMTTEPNAALEPGQSIEVVLDRQKIHLFDSETGTALVHGVEPPAESISK